MGTNWENNFKERLYKGLDSANVKPAQIPSCIARMDAALSSTYSKTTTGLELNLKECERSFNLIRNISISVMRLGGLTESEVLDICYRMGVKKNREYGDQNILKFGIVGIVVRLADKIGRLKTLVGKDSSLKAEAAADALLDIINYTAYGEMLCNSIWE